MSIELDAFSDELVGLYKEALSGKSLARLVAKRFSSPKKILGALAAASIVLPAGVAAYTGGKRGRKIGKPPR
ncbi:hypothetical protein LCGC14_1382530, partial [marine sediment metagenome]